MFKNATRIICTINKIEFFEDFFEKGVDKLGPLVYNN